MSSHSLMHSTPIRSQERTYDSRQLIKNFASLSMASATTLLGGTQGISDSRDAEPKLSWRYHKGRTTASEVHVLLRTGLVRKVSIDAADEELYLSLVSGEAAQTLDDGEAATLAWAASHGSVAIIDERKA